MSKSSVSLLLAGFTLLASDPAVAAEEVCADFLETSTRLVQEYFDRDPEPEMRAGTPRALPPEIAAFKNGSDREGRTFQPGELLSANSVEHRRLIATLRFGDRVRMDDGRTLTLGPMAGWGGTTHLFTLVEEPHWILRLPRAARIKFTNRQYSTLARKAEFFYGAYRDSVARARDAGLPVLKHRIENGLIFVERFESPLNAAAIALNPTDPNYAHRRRRLISLVERLRGSMGLADVHLDGLFWSESRDQWIIADFAEVRPAPKNQKLFSPVYAELIAEAILAYKIGYDELKMVSFDLAIDLEQKLFFSTRALPPTLRGIVTPLITPLISGTLDRAGLAHVVAHVIDAGIESIFVLGTTGEGNVLDDQVRQDLVRETCRFAGRNACVLVGLRPGQPSEVRREAKFAAENGASAVVISPPDGMHDQDEFLTHLREIAVESPLPILIYNRPGAAWKIPKETVIAASTLPNVVGLKDSSGDAAYFHELLSVMSERSGFSLLQGSERQLAESLCAGADGGVCGTSNLLPNIFLELYRAGCAMDGPGYERAAAAIKEVKQRISTLGNDPQLALKCFKAGAAMMGLCQSSELALPSEALAPDLGARWRDHLRALGCLVPKT